MKYFFFLVISGIVLFACQANDDPKTTATDSPAAPAAPETPQIKPTHPSDYAEPQQPLDENSIMNQPQVKEAVKKLKPQAHNTSADGEPILIRKVALGNTISQMMVQKGQKVHEEKCAGCHTLDIKKSSLTSLAGVTRRRSPEWIMNMTTGVNTQLESNAAAAKKLEACPTRQVATRLNIEQARDYLEMLRSVDSK